MTQERSAIAAGPVVACNPDGIPTDLTNRPTWVCWRYEERDGRTTKLPYDPKTGKRASTTDAATWSSFGEAVATMRRTDMDGVGFVFTADDPFCGVDLDGCFHSGKLDPHEQEWVEALNSYTEVSPSGTGVKVIFRGKLPEDLDRHSWGGDGIYQEGRYFALTGRVLSPNFSHITAPHPKTLEGLLNAWFPPVVTREWDEAEERLTDAEVLHKASHAANNAKFLDLWSGRWQEWYPSQSDADMGLVSMLAFYTGPCPQQLDRMFRRSHLMRPKWDEKRGDETYGQRTIARVLSLTETYWQPSGSRGAVTDRVVEAVDTTPTRRVGRLLSTITPEKVEWLWPGYIPYGKLTVVDGDPGLGKSTLTLDLAARLSTGRPMPGGTPTEAAGVVLLTAEDGMGDTVVPRLLAAGANLERIIDASTTDEHERLARLGDLGWLEANIAEVGARLVIVDPLMAFLGEKVNAYVDQDMRGVLGPLAKLAERTGAAIVVVRHPTKGKGTSALYRGGGSIGIAGAARSVLLVAKDPSDATRRVLAPVKGNLWKDPASLGFRLEDTEGGSPRVAWLGEVNYDADNLLQAPGDGHEGPQGARDEAGAFLREALAEGPQYSKVLQARALERGIAERTLERAQMALGVATWKERGVRQGKNLTGWPWQREAYYAGTTPVGGIPITTVADSILPLPNAEYYTPPHGGVDGVKDTAVVYTPPTPPTPPTFDDGGIGEVAPHVPAVAPQPEEDEFPWEEEPHRAGGPRRRWPRVA